jgi:hypothetical protein
METVGISETCYKNYDPTNVNKPRECQLKCKYLNTMIQMFNISPLILEFFSVHKISTQHSQTHLMYRCAPVSTGNTFQDLPLLRETADNIESYI